jgi:hypothetical protein
MNTRVANHPSKSQDSNKPSKKPTQTRTGTGPQHRKKPCISTKPSTNSRYQENNHEPQKMCQLCE